ncbi:MAG: LysR family transcriptional regulator [Halobacteriovoraceae bacterium]|jgi:LysR family transcriptional regulator, hydrogen peroxide-inducible genes activator|nr:LysR family transcriptional regulator [Halobacteriovoraceae bacterium]MBT5092780.1 LysR family transcriptional regulator [Halobacteriovoraceae bacterium]
MTLTQLEYVLAVAKFRHFHRAAAACHVTQPTLSMQLQKLELELDCILFDRSKSPVQPTAQGEKIIEQARVVLRESKRLLATADETQNEVSGSFHLGVIPTLATHLIPLFYRQFHRLYPDVELMIDEMKTEDIIAALEKDEIDAGLLVTPLHHGQIIERSLYREEFYVFASNEHPLLKKSKIEESQLQAEGLWLLNEGHCFRDQVLNICAMKKPGGAASSQFQSGSLETLKNLVQQGEGYTLLPELMVDQLSIKDKKNVRPFKKPVPIREVSLVSSRLFYKEKIMDALEKTIIDNLPRNLFSHKRSNTSTVEIY